MARIILPVRFLDQVTLISKISSKHTTDGVGSILTDFFTENSIVIADDVSDAGDALTAHQQFEQKRKDAKKLFKERDRIFNPIFAQHRRCVQNLKSLWAKNPSKLGDFGVTVNGKKVVYPKDVQGKIIAVITFIQKHDSFPAGTSPLQKFLDQDLNSDIDLAANNTNCGVASTHHTNASTLNDEKETKRAERDLLMTTPVANYALIGNYLVKTFSTNPNKAGDWGFTIDTSPKGTKVRTGFVNISSTKVLVSLAINSVLINNSDFNIEIYKGKTISGPAVVLQPGKKFPITTGYGTLTIKNPSTEEKAVYQGVFNQ